MTTATATRPPMGHGDNPHLHHLRPEAAVRDLEDRRGARTTLSHFDDSDDEDDNESAYGNSLYEGQPDDGVQTPTASSHSHIPLHPIPSMQEAFAESLEEATRADLNPKPKLRDLDAKQRRDRLLDQDRSHGPPHRLWRFRPGQRCHELRKLVAQISFGIELLIKGMANSNAQVLSILQGHIDEVDEFLEAAMEDVQEATLDLKARLDYLKVPLQNMDVFEQMLEDRKFRLQIVEGNIKIEHILSRTSTAHTQTIRDVSEGLWAVKQFSKYLDDNEHGDWRMTRLDVVDVFEAMKGNTEGWHSAFTALESNSTLLSGLLVQLSTLVGDIDKKAGEVSRRTRFTLEPYFESNGRSMPRSPDTLPEATPPPSPPTSNPGPPPRIRTMLFDESMGAFTQGPHTPESTDPLQIPDRSKLRETDQRITKDSNTLQNTMLANHVYTPPESSRIITDLATVREAHQGEEDSESQSVTESQTTHETESSNATDDDDDDNHHLFILQPRTYTPLPPAPLPSPRVSDVPTSPAKSPDPTARAPELTARIPIPDRGSPDELSIHIEAEEDDLLASTYENEVRETVLSIPNRDSRRRTNSGSTPSIKSLQTQSLQVKPLQVRTIRVSSDQDPQRTSRSSDKEVVLEHKTSLRERVSAKGEVPKAIHVPPVNAHEFHRPPMTTAPHHHHHEQQQHARYQTQSPRSAPQTSRGPEMQRHPEAGRRHHTQQLDDFTPPSFAPSLLRSPASERQHFHPVQASPHSPLQQRPHTAGTGGARLAAPSQMGMSTLSRVMTANPGTTSSAGTIIGGGKGRSADSTRTVKKKRSAFGWLKKAFSLDEEERAMFEARKRAMPVNYYQPYYGAVGGQSPRYLDGKRIG